jgi:polyhydroxybutyrate depolymerase
VRRTRYILLAILCLAIVGGSLYGYYGYSPAPPHPNLSSKLHEGSISIDGRERHYTFYVPANIGDDPALVFILHGSLQSVNDIRKFTAYEFELLADEHSFILVYPAGYKNNWNDCRATASYPARKENINDIKFISTLISEFHQRLGSDTAKTFIAGYSNGGHLGFRFAMESPNSVAAIAAISASLPTPENLACTDSGAAVPVLIMNGTEDPINPYYGGQVTLFGFGDRGQVLSSVASAEYFAHKAGYHGAPSEIKHFPNVQRNDPTATKYYRWRDDKRPEVILYTITDGGHTIPQPVFRPPRILGASSIEINGPEEIWAFFARQIKNKNTPNNDAELGSNTDLTDALDNY